jgi:hypothetical protein
MDASLTNTILSVANNVSRAQTSQAVQVSVLKKSMETQQNAAMALLQTLPQPALATSGTLGTQVNTYA